MCILKFFREGRKMFQCIGMFKYTMSDCRTWYEDYNRFRFGVTRQEESLLMMRLFKSYNKIISFQEYSKYLGPIMTKIDFNEALTIRDEEGNVTGKQRIVDCVEAGHGEHIQDPKRDTKLYQVVTENISSVERFRDIVNNDLGIIEKIDKYKFKISDKEKDIEAGDLNNRVLSYIKDECFMNYCIGMMMSHIGQLNEIIIASNAGLIDWVFMNLGVDEYKEALKSKNVNLGKVARYSKEIVFMPTYKSTCSFFKDENQDCPHPVFDVERLMNKLISNIILKTDIYIITAIYGIIFAAAIDFENKNSDTRPALYVRDILSKL